MRKNAHKHHGKGIICNHLSKDPADFFVIGQHFSVMSKLMKQCPAHTVFWCSDANDHLL